MTDSTRHDAVVIGGGIAGLAAAAALAGRDVVLFEAADRVGGRILCQDAGGYWLNLGAHILGKRESPMARLAAETGAELLPIQGHMAAVWAKGRLVRHGKVESYPFRLAMSPGARLSLIRTGLRLRAANRRASPDVQDAIHGDRAFAGSYPTVAGDGSLDSRSFAEVLGPMHPEVDALLRAGCNRLSGEPEAMSGHFGSLIVGGLWSSATRTAHSVRGGMGAITDGLVARLGNRIVTGATALGLEQDAEGVRLRVNCDGREETILARHAVIATPAPIARRIVSDLPEDKAAALDHVAYGPYVVMAAATTERGPMPYDDLYAIAVAGRTVTMIFNSANALRGQGQSAPRAPGGALMVYAGADKARALAGRTDDEIRALFIAEINEVLPETRGLIGETRIQRWEHGYPYWRPGRLAIQDALARPFGRIHFAGDYVEYPSTDPAARSGQMAAWAILQTLAGEDG
jgi:oxygen-dependent protoporphyrinogen oxidase